MQVADAGQFRVPGNSFEPFESFSVTSWVRPDDIAGTQTVVAFGASTPDWALLSAEGSLAWFVAGDLKTASDPVLVAGEVAHVGVTYSPDLLAIYVNGELVHEQADPDPVEFETEFDAFFSVGAVGTALPLSGVVDDVQFYDKALEADDLKWLFDRPCEPIGGDPDSDGDRLSDGDEVNVHGTDPLNKDTDGDGREDGDEIEIDPATDPLNPDTDGDQFGDQFELDQGTDPTDANDVPDGIAEWDHEWHVLEALPTFDGFDGGLDRQDVTFRVWIDFREAEVSADNSEMIWESGGGTVGFSLVYDAGNVLVLRAAGNGGNTVTEVRYELTSEQLAAGELPVTWTFDVDNGDAATGQTIALFVGDVLVGEDSGDMDPDWTGSNGASFGVATGSFAAGGENTALSNDVEFASGDINLEKGLRMFADFLFEPGGVTPPPGPAPVALGFQFTEGGATLTWSGNTESTFDVEYTTDLNQWIKINPAPVNVGADGVGSFEDTDADRLSGATGLYRAVENP